MYYVLIRNSKMSFFCNAKQILCRDRIRGLENLFTTKNKLNPFSLALYCQKKMLFKCHRIVRIQNDELRWWTIMKYVKIVTSLKILKFKDRNVGVTNASGDTHTRTHSRTHTRTHTHTHTQSFQSWGQISFTFFFQPDKWWRMGNDG